MNYKNENILEYGPLRRVVSAIYDEDESRADLIESLKERGYDPDAIIIAVKANVQNALRAERLAWQAEAKRKLAALRSLRDTATDWAARAKTEIDDAFAKVLAGTFGQDAKLKVQAAFRNLDQVSTEDKASFLNDLDALSKCSDNKACSEDK